MCLIQKFVILESHKSNTSLNRLKSVCPGQCSFLEAPGETLLSGGWSYWINFVSCSCRAVIPVFTTIRSAKGCFQLQRLPRCLAPCLAPCFKASHKASILLKCHHSDASQAQSLSDHRSEMCFTFNNSCGYIGLTQITQTASEGDNLTHFCKFPFSRKVSRRRGQGLGQRHFRSHCSAALSRDEEDSSR